jgi:L-threonylcarbamoyladenylate synthase
VVATAVEAASSEAIARAAEIIRAGGLVAFPTETVYGLGANALDSAAVARIYAAKQRALNDPLIVHVSASAHLARLRATGIVGAQVELRRKITESLIAVFWPGPLTLVLPRGVRVPPIVSAGLDTVAVRMPDHPVAQALIEASGVPIAAPSANRFGGVSPTTAQHVLDDLGGRIDLILDGGPARVGVESTVLDLTGDFPRILRPGGVTREQLAALLGGFHALGARLAQQSEEVRGSAESTSQSPRPGMPSPGMLDSHYAPRARVILYRDATDLLARHGALVAGGVRVGVLILDERQAICENIHPQFVLGRDLNDVARNLYAGLRALDGAGVDVILAPHVERHGIGEAIADRLTRAAADRGIGLL